MRSAPLDRPTRDDRRVTSANAVYWVGVELGRRHLLSELAMRINRLDLTNFRCFDERSFTFHERFTLLIGVNATGKTTVLDALAVALGAALIPIPHALSGSIHRRDVRRTHQHIGETGHFVEHYPVRVEARGSIDGHDIGWKRALRSAKSRTTRGGTRTIREVMNQLVRRSAPRDDVVLPYIGYYGTGRLWREQRLLSEGGIDPARRSSRYVGYQNCLTPSSSARHLSAWIKRLALIEARRGPLATLHAVLGAIADCVEDAVAAYFDFEEDDIVVQFETDRFPFRSLSDGQRNMAATAADIAMRCAQLNPQLNDRARLETPGVVLIDEVDLHLHPRWQRTVVGDMTRTFPRLQFVATSHSPFIVQSVSDGGVINLDREDSEPETPHHQSVEDVAENIMGVHQPQRSKRYQDMMEAAEKYYRILENAGAETDQQVSQQLRDRLDELEEPFADNPAYVAFLRLQRAAKNLQ